MLKFMNNKIIKVFEYDTLAVNETFREKHFTRLVHYNETHGNKFFSVGNKRIYFRQYVGVIQVGSLIIEILPKPDKHHISDESAKDTWHNTLVEMLRECGFIKLESLTSANLKLRSASLIDLYFKTFLDEVQLLIHHGLVKKYRCEEANLFKLKGRIVFSRHISENLIHRERVYTAHQIYDKDNITNQILKKALRILVSITDNQSLVNVAKTLQLSFDEISDTAINENTFNHLTFNRKTNAYKTAIQLARLIILNFSPDIKAGGENVLAILFDMNKLFEGFIYKRLKHEESDFSQYNLTVKGQSGRLFWKKKTIRPDIILDYTINDELQRVIIDTKWKMLAGAGPSDDDLKQIFAYNVHFKSFRGVLLYPEGEDGAQAEGAYERSLMFDACPHFCRTYSVKMFNKEGKIKKDLGKEIIGELTHLISSFPNL